MFVLTADQIASRRRGDLVPMALATLGPQGGEAHGWLLPFQRTVGDEIQGVAGTARAVVEATTLLTRLGGWRIGIGVQAGRTGSPLGASARESTGPAFVAAREAIERARKAPVDLAVHHADPDERLRDSSLTGAASAELAEGVLWLVVAMLKRRTVDGWEIVDLLATSGSAKEAAATLGVSPSAVSQRLSRSAHREVVAAQHAATWFLAQGGEDLDRS